MLWNEPTTLSVRLSFFCLSVCLYACMCACRYVHLCVCLSGWLSACMWARFELVTNKPDYIFKTYNCLSIFGHALKWTYNSLLPVCLSVSQPVSQSVCLSVCLPASRETENERKREAEKSGICDYLPWPPWSKWHFCVKLSNGHNKLECHITLGRQCPQRTNTLAYWAHS